MMIELLHERWADVDAISYKYTPARSVASSSDSSWEAWQVIFALSEMTGACRIERSQVEVRHAAGM